MDDLALALEYDRTAELHDQLATRARDTVAAAMHRRTARHFRDLAAELRQEVRG